MKEYIQRIFFNDNFERIEIITPIVGFRLLGIGLSIDEHFEIQKELMEIYKNKLQSYEYQECMWNITDEIYQCVEPVVNEIIKEDEIYKETYYDGEIISGYIPKEQFIMHITNCVVESGSIPWGLSDLILEDLVELDIETREKLLDELRKSIKWYSEIYSEAKEEILNDLNKLLEKRNLKPGDELTPIFNAIVEERMHYKK